MKTLRINADEVLCRNSMLPEGILERWLVADGDTAHAGHAIRRSKARCTTSWRRRPAGSNQSAPRLSVVDPGFLLATITVGAEVAAEA